MDETRVLRTNIILALACLGFNYFLPSGYWILASAGFLSVTLVVYPLARLIATGWLKFSDAIGAFNARVILAILYYLVLTPWSFVVGLIREDPMHRVNPPESSMFETRNKTFQRDDFERIS